MCSKIVQDAVHGVIELEPLAVQVIDSPEFQRLREIKQLGITYFVFPSSQHSRFEHSIGTYHLAKKLLEAIHNDQNYSGPTLNFQEQLSVRIAALCHDLGHGPFSHMWEEFVKKGGSEYSQYKHEKISGHVLEKIVRSKPSLQNELNNLNVDMKLILSLILGDSSAVLSNEIMRILHYLSNFYSFTDRLKQKPFIYEILSNSLNGMDVDKWDYLLRDCLYSGIGASGTNVDIDRFLRFYRPFLHTDQDKYNEDKSCCWHLSFKDTELENLLRTFSLRQHLHQKFISTRLSQLYQLCIECQDPNDLDEFLKLHDSLLWDIYYRRGSLSNITSNDHLPQIQKAQSLIRRILNRDLYTYIDSIYEMSYYAPNDDIENYQHSSGQELSNSINETATQSLALRSMGLGLGPRKSLCYEPIPPHYRTFGVTPNDIGRCSKESILIEIFKRLPQNSGINCMNDLLVTESRFTSNSTSESPKFYFYTRSGSTFTYSEPHQNKFSSCLQADIEPSLFFVTVEQNYKRVNTFHFKMVCVNIDDLPSILSS
ncbi:unnamed protein product [Heterobilharzia americana]|nr:unnamed protein product [Heterobilharzia americana]